MDISYRFWKDLADYKQIYIYGNGRYGQQLYQALCTKGWNERVISYVVTADLINILSDAVPTCTVNELPCCLKESIIIIAVGRKYLEQIEKELESRGIHNYIAIIDYEQMEKDDVEFLRSASIEECCKYMADFHISRNNLENEVNIREKEYYLGLALHRPEIEKNNIIVICGNVNIGLSKIIIALKKKGFWVEIWKFRPTYSASPAECELRENGISIEELSDYGEVLCRAIERNPLVFYLNLPIGGIYIDEILIKLKTYFGKMIFTEGDVIKINEYDVPKEWYQVEKYCLENADGVIWRYPAKDFLAREYGYQYKGISIHMWDYCTDYHGSMKEDTDKTMLKICFLPTNVSHHLDDGEEIQKYVHYATLFELLEKFGNKKNCIFHCYSWNASDEDLSKLKKLKKRYSNFEYFIHVPHSKLIELMQHYDYGIQVPKKTTPMRFPTKYRGGVLYTKQTLTYAVANKFFDFLAAGIPVIGYYPEIELGYFDSLGVAVKQYLDELDIDYLINFKHQYKENVEKAKEELAMDTHIAEVIDFINKL